MLVLAGILDAHFIDFVTFLQPSEEIHPRIKNRILHRREILDFE